MIFELILLVPTPNSFMDSDLTIYISDIDHKPISFRVEDLLAAYILMRFVYFLKFLIHF